MTITPSLVTVKVAPDTIPQVFTLRDRGPQGVRGSAFDIKGSVTSSAALPSSGQSLGWAYVSETDGHAWVYTGSTSIGSINGFIDAGAIGDTLPLPLFTVTGHGASLPPGETPLANYANQAAFEAAVNPVAQAEKVQLAAGGVVRVLEARWVAGVWKWKDVT